MLFPPLATLQALVKPAMALALVGSLWAGYEWIYSRGAASVQVKWDAVKLEQERESAVITANARVVTEKLKGQVEANRRESNEKIIAINKSYAAAIAGLRNRPARPSQSASSVPKATGEGAGCTGAELYGPDGAFLIRESARADRLRLQLERCESDYAKAYKALNGTE